MGGNVGAKSFNGSTLRPWFNKSKGTKILFFIARILLMQEIFIMKLITEELRIKFFIAGISLLKGCYSEVSWYLLLKKLSSVKQGHILKAIHILPNVLLKPTMPFHSTLCQQPPLTASGMATHRAGNLRLFYYPSWIPHAIHLCIGIWLRCQKGWKTALGHPPCGYYSHFRGSPPTGHKMVRHSGPG
jgi:hypothetical protein